MTVELGLGHLIQRQLTDGTAGRPHNGRVGQCACAQACGKTGVEFKDNIHQQDRAQCRGTEHHGKQHQLEGPAIEAAEKFRPALEAHGVDEQHKEHRLQDMGHLQPDLANQQPHQQGPRHRAQMEAAQVNPANQHTEGNRQEHGYFGRGTQGMNNEVDH